MPRILLLSLIMLAVVRPFLRAEDAKTNPLQPLDKQKRIERWRQEKLAFQRKVTIDAYKEFGKHDPKWDQFAEEALEAWAARMMECFAEIGLQEKTWRAAKKAVEAGCNDPLIWYCYGRYCADQWQVLSPEAIERAYMRAVANLKDSKYPAIKRAFIMLRATGQKMWAHKNYNDEPELLTQIKEMHEACKPLIAVAFKDKQAARDDGLSLWEIWSEQGEKLGISKRESLDQLQEVLKKEDVDKSMQLLVEGSFYIDYAWQARGDSLADKVGEDNWKLFKERLEKAETALENAWKLDPENPFIAYRIMSVELGQGKGRKRLELWFDRTMNANPDFYFGCDKKLLYLQPKWHGSIDEMLDFAHRMLREGNWKGGLPFVLEEAHMSIATCYANDEAAYWQTPIVGQDIKALFEAYLKVYPNNNSQRTAYAKMAYKCGLYAEATEQFDILGKDYWGLRFKDKKEYEAMRADAKTKALLNNKK